MTLMFPELRKSMKIRVNCTVFWDITPCSPLKSQLTFLRNISPPSSGFFLGLVFDAEVEGDMFIRNVL
jgi:hypothetical protein